VRLIDDVLLLSRCMTGHLQITAAPISPLAPLNAAIDSARAAATAGLVALPSVVAGTAAMVMADEALLRRAFEILLKHAIDATPKGKSIAVAIDLQGGQFTVAIADQGIAPTVDVLATLFDAFSEDEGTSGRVHADDARNLMLAKMLVEKQGGELRATGGDGLDKGTGTRFTMSLPRIDVNAVLTPKPV
jgi:signal transduction histidine kinase